MPFGIRSLREHGRRSSLLFSLRATQSDPLPHSATVVAKDSYYLCTTCRKADLAGLFTFNRDEPEWELENVINQTRCEFCRLLKQLVLDDYVIGDLAHFVLKHAMIRLERCSLWEYKYRGGVVGGTTGRRAAIYISGAKGDTSGQIRLQDMEDGSCIFPLSRGAPAFGLSARSSEVDVKLICSWLAACTENHGHECWKPTDRMQVPQYLIDVKKQCIVTNPGSSHVKYLALSYVWGQHKQSTLLQAKLKGWQKKDSLAQLELPQTVRDAIVLTKDIGERYLWVDSLCMVQDDPQSLQKQIERMHLVYKQAYLTIIVAVGEDSKSGIPGIRNSPHRRPLQDIATIGSLQLSKLDIKAHAELRKSVWNSRGWTFQEEICSSRRLIFTKSGMSFNCMAATWREDFPERLIVNSRERHSYLYSSFTSATESTDEEKKDILKWYSMILQNYLSRHLSNASDILKGFAGVTSLVSQTLGPSSWGLLENYFHEAICWNTVEHAPISRRSGFPSWSWAAYHFPKFRADKVAFQLIPRYDGHAPEAVVQFIDLSRPEKIWPQAVEVMHDHFRLDSKAVMNVYSHIAEIQRMTKQLIGFCSSSAHLLVEVVEDPSKDTTMTYLVRCPDTRTLLCSFLASPEIFGQNTSEQEFVVIGQIPARGALFDSLTVPQDFAERLSLDERYNEQVELERHAKAKESFLLMMITRDGADATARRVCITTPVPKSRWWATETKGTAIVLG